MVEHVGHIRNPLTIVAIFAALAEVSGTVILPLIPLETQLVYVYFLMFFPIVLLLLFFGVLVLKHHVLYAPSDFSNDEIFKDILQHRPYIDAMSKLDNESEVASESEDCTIFSEKIQNLSSVNNNSFVVSYRGYSIYVKDLVIEKISREMRLNFDRYLALKENSKVVFDAVSYGKDRAVVLDIFFTRMGATVKDKIDNFVYRAKQFVDGVPVPLNRNILFVFSIVTDREDRLDKILNGVAEFHSESLNFQSKVDLRVFLLKSSRLEDVDTR
ncbi:hypothetical protein [Desulfolutivibrio sp.]|uniref:hypothetical protein n=1 Tax=Desulfolutivibrio sp. TaxID=2773296 RepID=UPI002F96C882